MWVERRKHWLNCCSCFWLRWSKLKANFDLETVTSQTLIAVIVWLWLCVFHLALLLQIIQITPQLVDLLRVDGCFLWTFLQLCFQLGYSHLQYNIQTLYTLFTEPFSVHSGTEAAPLRRTDIKENTNTQHGLETTRQQLHKKKTTKKKNTWREVTHY